jgi:hypothetical protein
LALLRRGRNRNLRRSAREITVTQQQKTAVVIAPATIGQLGFPVPVQAPWADRR